MENRMQLKLRNAIDFKVAQGFEVVDRTGVITLARGGVRVQVSMLNGTPIVRNV